MLKLAYIASPKQYNACFYIHDDVMGEGNIVGRLLVHGIEFSLTMGNVTFSSMLVSR